MQDILRYSWKEIKRRKSRSLGIIFGYAVAVAFLVITLSFTSFLNLGTNAILKYTGAQFIGFINSSYLKDSGIHFADPAHERLSVFNNPTALFSKRLIEQIKQSPNVKHAAPLLSFTIMTDKFINRSCILAGFDPADMESVRMSNCSATDIVKGRQIEPGDTGVILLEQTFADAKQYSVENTISLGGKSFRVVGILSPGTRPAKADIYMPIEEATEVLNTRIEEPVGNVANAVLVDGASSLLNRKAIDDVKEILGFNSSTLGYGCFNPAGAAIGITRRGMQLLGFIVFAGILLLVAASQFYSVVERRNDIGILKAIGWSDRNVVMQVFAESFFQSVIGGLAGCIVAVILFTFFPIADWFGLNEAFSLSLNIPVLLTGYVLTVLVSVVAGAGSAMMSAALKPAEILRTL